MRRGLFVSVSFVVSTAIIVACSSSFGEDATMTPDSDGGAEGGGGSEASNACVAAPGKGPPTGVSGCDGCTSELLVMSSPKSKLGALTGGVLFFTAQDPGVSTAGILERLELVKGVPTVASMHPKGIEGITSDESRTYVVEQSGGLTSAIAADGKPSYAVSGAPLPIGLPIAASHGVFVYVDTMGQILTLSERGDPSKFSLKQPTLLSITLDERAAYWSTALDNATNQSLLGRADLAANGGNLTLVPVDEGSGALTTDESFLYFYAASKGEFRRVAKDLKSPSEVIATWTGAAASNADFLLVDGTTLYALLGSPFTSILVKMPKCGGVPRQIAPEANVTLYGDGRLAVDAKYMYFTSTDGAIRRTPK